MDLYLKVIDLQTRIDARNECGDALLPDEEELDILDGMIFDAGKKVVAHMEGQGCPDIRLKMKIMDLNTRLKLQST